MWLLRAVVGTALIIGAFTISSAGWSHTTVRLSLVGLLMVWALVMAVIQIADRTGD